MKLYAIEHEDGGRWWSFFGQCWTHRPADGCLQYEREECERIASDHPGNGTVVTFNLTREPELRVGARVVGREHIHTVSDVYEFDGGTWVSHDTADECADDLIVLPEEGE